MKMACSIIGFKLMQPAGIFAQLAVGEVWALLEFISSGRGFKPMKSNTNAMRDFFSECNAYVW